MSSFWSGDFYFDGVYSNTLNVCAIDFNSTETLKEHGLNTSYDLEKNSSLNGTNVYNITEGSSENIILQLCRADKKAWDLNSITQVNRWLNKEGFKRFQINDFKGNGYNIVYYLKMVSFKKFLSPNLEGYLEYEFASYDNYAYIIPPSNPTMSSSAKTTDVNNFSTLYTPYKPKIKIKNLGAKTDVIKIVNGTNSSFLELKGLDKNEEVIVDCKMNSVLNTSTNDNRFEVLNNYDFIQLNMGSNQLTLQQGNAQVEIISEYPISL